MANTITDRIFTGVATLLRVPDRASHLAKVEHAVMLYLGYLAVRKGLELGPRGALNAVVATVLRAARRMPGVAGAVEKEQAEILGKIKAMVLGEHKNENPHYELPAEGQSAESIVAEIKELRGQETKFHSGRGMGGIYHNDGNELCRMQNEVWGVYNASNALYPGLFPAVRKFEAEVVRMILTMVNGDKDACGTLSSGGTESVLLACLAYREYGRKKGITRPEIVCCVSAHAALDKAAHYFGIKLVRVPQGENFRMSVPHVKRAITSNTVAIYASAPTFPHGAIDDIDVLGEIAQKRGVGLHVDNCLGGFLLSYLVKEGYVDRAFDFKVPGVTSMSVDVHKYGLAAKGASCVVYRSGDLRKCQYTAVADWTGGLYATPTMQGSRSGAIMATAWATLMYHGDKGYRHFARQMGDLHKKLKTAIAAIPGLKLMGNCDACIVSYGSDDFNIYVCADEMSKRGWEVPRLQRPACCHICVGEAVIDIADDYLKDLAECAAIAMASKGDKSKEKEGMAGIYGMAGSLPDRTIVTDLLSNYMDVLYMVDE